MRSIRNNYGVQSVISMVEGVSAVAAIGLLFYDWRASVVSAAVFVLCLPAKNYVRFGRFYPGKSRTASAPVASAASGAVISPLQETSGSLSRQAETGPAKTI